MIGKMWDFLRNALLPRFHRQAKTRRRYDRGRTLLWHEPLESRELLAVSQVTYNASTSEVLISGTPLNDLVSVVSTPGGMITIRAQVGSEVVDTSFARSSVALIKFYGKDGHDRFENNTDVASQAYGENGNDLLSGGSANDRMYGGFGDDLLIGSNGDDELNGQDGNDLIRGVGGNDLLIGGRGNDLISGGMGDDRVYGDEGNDDLRGDEGADELYGGDGYDVLLGGFGNDRLYGGIDDDRLYGMGDDDQLVGQDGDDYMDGGNDDDLLDGGRDSDKLIGGSGVDQLYGNEGNDQLFGGSGDDRLFGDDGNDFLYGEADDDYMLGGMGNDTLYGGDGNDEVRGQDGNDFLDGGAGGDLITGGIGNDRIFGGSGDDRLYGDEGQDELWGGDDNDQLFGLAGNSVLFGGAGNDQLFAAGGNNLLVGGAGDDTLVAGVGKDVLIGGTGADGLNAGAGEDLLIGGTTSYDENLPSLNLLMAAWTSSATYDSRVAQIEDELFAARLESNETVLDDLVADSLFGAEDQDWFFLTGYMAIYDPNSTPHEHDEPTAHDDSHGHTHPGAIVLDHLPEVEGFALIDSLDKLDDRVAGEKLSTLIPHADDAALQREHLSLFQLVRYDQVTHWAVQSGNWTDPSTWNNGVVPGAGARVLIPIGVQVTVNGVIAQRLATVRVDGTLSFATNVNTELRVDTVVVSTVGAFEMGTATQPIAANVRARLLITNNGPIDRTADPFGISRGLISHGRVSMHGRAVTSQAAVIGAVNAGATILQLNVVPSGWKVGDKIVIAAASPGAQYNEVRTIAGLSGNRVLLAAPLSYYHIPPAGMQVHVAHTTRNAVIESESLVTERRGHVMFMHNQDVNVAYAGFYGLGRTNKLVPVNDPVVDANWQLEPGTGTNPRGRYSVHFHRNGIVNDGSPAVVRGSAVVDSPGWGFVSHTSYVDMLDNVAYDVSGAAFVTEVGNEIGNFHRNIAIGGTGSGQATEARQNIQDFGHQGDGFWFQGSGISVVGNIAAGNEGSAFIIFSRGLIEGGEQQKFDSANLANPEIAGGAAEIDVRLVPMLEFRNNIGYASGTGLNLWYQLERVTHNVKSVFSNSQFWNNFNGAQLPYSQQTVLENLVFVYAPGLSEGIGIDANVVTRDIEYRNLIVSGYTRGIVVPYRGYAIIEGGSFSNQYDIFILTAVAADRTVLVNGVPAQTRVHMVTYYRPAEFGIQHAFARDIVLLNYGGLINQRAYYNSQLPASVPFPMASPGVPAEYVGKTALQLWTQFGLAIGGTLAPAGTISVPLVNGGVVGPAS